MRRSASSIRRQHCRHLGDPHLKHSSLHNHLAGELHPGCSEFHFANRLFAKAAKSTMKITTGTSKKKSPHSAKHGIAEIPVQKRHGTGLDPALETVSHNQVVPLTQLCHKARNVKEVVAIVGISHDHVPATSRSNATDQRIPVPSRGDLHKPRPLSERNSLRAVGAAVIGNDDLAID